MSVIDSVLASRYAVDCRQCSMPSQVRGSWPEQKSLKKRKHQLEALKSTDWPSFVKDGDSGRLAHVFSIRSHPGQVSAR